MIINNYDLIRPLLKFPTDKELEGKGLMSKLDTDYFYVVQLIQRKKDNPTKIFGNPNHRTNSNRSLYQTHIYSLDDFDNKFPLLIELAKIYQARVYINLNLKSSYKAFINLVKNVGCRLETNNYKKMTRIYNEAVGECKGSIIGGDKWIVDIDFSTTTNSLPEFFKGDIINKIKNELYTLKGGGKDGKAEIYCVIPTKMGYHLITSSFDLEEFRKWENDYGRKPLDVHKDNPTILWMETNWSNN